MARLDGANWWGLDWQSVAPDAVYGQHPVVVQQPLPPDVQPWDLDPFGTSDPQREVRWHRAPDYEICTVRLREFLNHGRWGTTGLGRWWCCPHDVLWGPKGATETTARTVLRGLQEEGWLTPAERGVVPPLPVVMALRNEALTSMRMDPGTWFGIGQDLAEGLRKAINDTGIHALPCQLPHDYALQRHGNELVLAVEWGPRALARTLEQAEQLGPAWRVPWPDSGKRGRGAWLAT